MKVYQVTNNVGEPASNEFNDLCIFPSQKLALEYIDYLVGECGRIYETFIIKEVTLFYN